MVQSIEAIEPIYSRRIEILASNVTKYLEITQTNFLRYQKCLETVPGPVGTFCETSHHVILIEDMKTLSPETCRRFKSFYHKFAPKRFLFHPQKNLLGETNLRQTPSMIFLKQSRTTTSRERPNSAPYPRLKNSKRTSKCQSIGELGPFH